MTSVIAPGVTCLILAAVLAGCSQPPVGDATAAKPSADTTGHDVALARIVDRVSHGGAKRYLDGVTDADPDWAHLLDRAADGDAQALALVRRLRGAADAGTAEALDIAVARALPKAPAAVLASIAAGGHVETSCTSPFIEPEAGVERRYRAAALKALDSLPLEQRPQPVFDACRAALVSVARHLAS